MMLAAMVLTECPLNFAVSRMFHKTKVIVSTDFALKKVSSCYPTQFFPEKSKPPASILPCCLNTVKTLQRTNAGMTIDKMIGSS
jgi:hypothetical protein